MACCVIGSLLLVFGAAVVRALKSRLFGIPSQAPERWRLPPER